MSKLDILHMLLLLPSRLCPTRLFNASYSGDRQYYRLSSMLLYSGCHYVTLVRGAGRSRSSEWAVLDDDKSAQHLESWHSVLEYCARSSMRPTMLFFKAVGP